MDRKMEKYRSSKDGSWYMYSPLEGQARFRASELGLSRHSIPEGGRRLAITHLAKSRTKGTDESTLVWYPIDCQERASHVSETIYSEHRKPRGNFVAQNPYTPSPCFPCQVAESGG